LLYPNDIEEEATAMRRKSLWLVAAFALLAVVLVLPTSQAARGAGCLVLNERTRQVFNTLQGGIDAARPADTLNVVGTCHGISTISIDLTIKGVGLTGSATLDGDDLGTVLTITDKVTVTINKLTITDGTANLGGGIFSSGTVTLTDSIVRDNTANTDGGGIFSTSTLTLTRSAVRDNTAATFSGGGISHQGEGTLTLTDSTVSENTASQDGGGIFNSTAPIRLTHSTVSGNTTNSDGGGILNGDGTVTLTNSTVRSNTAHRGGGIFNARASNSGKDYGTVTLTNSIVRDNTANAGGGIFNYNGTATLTTSNVDKNAATTGEGGGIYNDNIGILSLTNSTVNKNTGTQSGIDIYSLGKLTLSDNR
jgi:predicted outer membrane repeat protein